MATVVVDADFVTVELTGAEKLETLHGDVTIPRASVVDAREVPDAMAELHGMRAPGTGLPGVLMAGTWRSAQEIIFAVCHGRRPGVVIDLVDTKYDRIVLTVDDPGQVLAALR